MKNLILNFVLILTFFVGSTVANAAIFGGPGVLVVLVVDKNSASTNALTFPPQFVNSNGTLTSSYCIEVRDYATKQVVFTAETKEFLLDLSGLSLKQGHYVVTLKIGDYTDSLVIKS